MEQSNVIDDYIAGCVPEVREMLAALCGVIREAAPGAVERIAYGMPTFSLHGNVVHFAAFRHHIGFYPGSSGVAAFADRLVGYKLSKGTVQFPLGKPMPLDLVAEIVRFRVAENSENAAKKR